MAECPWCLHMVSIGGGNCNNCGTELGESPEQWAERKPLSAHNRRAA